MRGLARWLFRAVAVLALAAGAVWLFGPREPVDTTLPVDSAAIAADPEGWLAAREARVANLREGSGARIIRAAAPAGKTPLAVVYLHGFSADPEEIRPVPDRVAAALGANLVFARLSGHGRDGAAMTEPRAGDWIRDTREAVALGGAVGGRVLLIGTSTGGTLAALAALDPATAPALAGVVLVSPNLAIADPAAGVLTLPLARLWVPLVAGAERRWEPANAAQAAHWTHAYPTVSVIPLAALVEYAMARDFEAAAVPALFLFSDADRVVRPEATRQVAGRWGRSGGGSATLHPVDLPEGSDPSFHVVAGDILSPSMTPEVVAAILDWTRGLEP